MAITTVMRMQTVLILRVAIFACAHLDSLEMAPHAMVCDRCVLATDGTNISLHPQT